MKCPLCETDMETEDDLDSEWVVWVCPVDDYTIDQVKDITENGLEEVFLLSN